MGVLVTSQGCACVGSHHGDELELLVSLKIKLVFDFSYDFLGVDSAKLLCFGNDDVKDSHYERYSEKYVLFASKPIVPPRRLALQAIQLALAEAKEAEAVPQIEYNLTSMLVHCVIPLLLL